MWQFDSDLGWSDCTTDVQRAIGEAVVEHRDLVFFACQGHAYEINLRDLTQRNVATGTLRRIRRTPRRSLTTWACPACTFDNAAGFVRCNMCGTHNPDISGLGEIESGAGWQRAEHASHVERNRGGYLTDNETASLRSHHGYGVASEHLPEDTPARVVRRFSHEVRYPPDMVSSYTGDDLPREAAQSSRGHRVLPVRKLTREDVRKAPADRKQCVICMEDYAAGEMQATAPCFHCFHAHCFVRWLERSRECPICKCDVCRA